MPKPKKGQKAQKTVAKETFEANKKLAKSKVIALATEITGLNKNYVVRLYSEWQGKKKEVEKPKNIQCLEIFENNNFLDREELLNKVMMEVEVTKGYAINLYNMWNDDTPVKPKPKDTYIVKYKGRLRETFVFDDSKL